MRSRFVEEEMKAGLAGPPTGTFHREIEKYSPAKKDVLSADDIVMRCARVRLSASTVQRQKDLCKSYSYEGPLYKETNQSMRSNDQNGMRDKAGFVVEFRDVFRTGKENSIVTPFVGTVYRGIRVNSDINEYLSYYKVGKVFYWPAFTSTSTKPVVSTFFKGYTGVTFVIHCNSNVSTQGKYCCASISSFSAFPCENEVVLPPQVKLQVLSVQLSSRTVELKIIELPSVLSVPKFMLKWEYYVDDGVYWKSTGWYPYDTNACRILTESYEQSRNCTVRSGWHSYKVDFTSMKQTNESTAKTRAVRSSPTVVMSSLSPFIAFIKGWGTLIFVLLIANACLCSHPPAK